MKIGNLVKIVGDGVFGTIEGVYLSGDMHNTIYTVKHEDGEFIEYDSESLEIVDYYSMLKELLFRRDYNQSKYINLSKSGLVIDGLELTKEQAIDLATDVLEYYTCSK